MGSYLAERDVRHDRVLAEGAAAHEVVHCLTLACEPRRAVRHHTCTLGHPGVNERWLVLSINQIN